MMTQLWRKVMSIEITLLIILLSKSCSQMESDKHDYLAIVKNYADTMLKFGRDHYGEKTSPLFAATLDLQTLSLPEGEKLDSIENLDRKEWGIRRNDRTLSGANIMHQENLYQVLYGLKEVTGEKLYAEEADKSLKWFFNHCQSPVTGLLVWGEHMGWDFRTDTVMTHYNKIKHSVGQGVTHEFYRPWVLWERSFQLAPEACEQFALGLWNHQIYDQETGDFSRHAKWDRHAPGQHSQYPRHGGFYIATWAEAYKQTKDQIFLDAIETLLNFFERNSSKQSGAIPAEVGHQRSEGKMMWPKSNVSLAVDLWDASYKVPDSLGERMRDRASRTDEVYIKMKHALSQDGEGFITQANVHTLEAEDVRNMGKRVYSHLWETGYGENTYAAIANLCYLRYRQVKQEGYRDLILAAANRYMNSEPDIDFPVYPGTLGDVIYLMINTYELTGEQKYLNRAEYFADQAISMFFPENSPLPAASSKHNHYEAITREDTLMMALLKLYTVKNKKDSSVSLIWCDR